MSQENVGVVRRCNRYWADRDLSQMPELVDPDVVIDLSRNVFNPDVYRGYDGIERLVAGVDEMWERFELDVEEVLDGGDTIFTATRISGRGRDGVEVDMPLFQIWTIRDGKVVRMTGGYREREDALEAAGLSE